MMRKLFSTLIAVLSIFQIASCTAIKEFPTGIFLHEDSGDVIIFQDNGAFQATTPEGLLFISGSYTIDGNKLKVTDSDEKSCEPELPETYTWTFNGSVLSIRAINENACLLRRGEINLTIQQ